MSSEGLTGRRALAAAIAAALAALTAGATSGSADTGSAGNQSHRANHRPHASLRISDRRVAVGQKVLLDASHSRDSDGRIVYHLWDLDGDGVYETATHRRARIHHAWDRAGTVRVGVVVIDDDGGYSVRRERIKVVRQTGGTHTAPAASSSHGRHRHHRVHAATKSRRGHHRKAAKKSSSAPSSSPAIHAASTGSGVTISDFKFAPKSITVSVGTTVTWTNQGPTAHSATADDGTFDTGTLTKGQMGTYQFTKPGTYNYHCTPHPFMKASVTVTGSGGSSPSSTSNDKSTNSSGGSNGSSGGSHSHSSLPHTGLEIASFVLAGLALLGGGLALRRRLARA